MANKVYMKEGVGFEGISMMQEMKSNTPKKVGILIGFVIIGLFGIGIGFIINDKKVPEVKPNVMATLPTRTANGASKDPIITAVPTITQIPTSTPDVTVVPTKKVTITVKSVSPTPTLALVNSLTVAVLNGSGEKGAAKNMSRVLSKAGYIVTRTGNADAFTYKGILISMKNSTKHLLDGLKKTLSVNNYLITNATTILSETSSVDIEVIVGTE